MELPGWGPADMEITGGSGHRRLNELSVEMGAALTLARRYEAAGEEFNLNSTRQLSVVLFEKLSFPAEDQDRLLHRGGSAGPRPPSAVDKILQHRAAETSSTYVDALPQLVNPQTGRIHTSFNQTVVTGRLSSADESSEHTGAHRRGPQIRRVFVAGGPGWVIVSADYSVIELRVLAHIR